MGFYIKNIKKSDNLSDYFGWIDGEYDYEKDQLFPKGNIPSEYGVIVKNILYEYEVYKDIINKQSMNISFIEENGYIVEETKDLILTENQIIVYYYLHEEFEKRYKYFIFEKLRDDIYQMVNQDYDVYGDDPVEITVKDDYIISSTHYFLLRYNTDISHNIESFHNMFSKKINHIKKYNETTNIQLEIFKNKLLNDLNVLIENINK